MDILAPSYQPKYSISGPLKEKKRAVFLDRDGVINVNYGYVHNIDNFEFIDGIFEVARAAHFRGYKLIVITNQSGIGRGYFSEQQFLQLTEWMCGEFFNEGVPIEKVYFSPFHPTAGIGFYKKNDVSRKPQPGMIHQAQRDINLNLESSILIGDEVRDIQAGIAAGVGLNLFFGQKRSTKPNDLPCHVISTLGEALLFIDNNC